MGEESGSALSGSLSVKGGETLVWRMVFLRTEVSEEDGATWRHVYECVVVWSDGEELRWEKIIATGERPEGLAAQVMLKAAWHQRAKDKPKGRGKRGV